MMLKMFVLYFAILQASNNKYNSGPYDSQVYFFNGQKFIPKTEYRSTGRKIRNIVKKLKSEETLVVGDMDLETKKSTKQTSKEEELPQIETKSTSQLRRELYQMGCKNLKNKPKDKLCRMLTKLRLLQAEKLGNLNKHDPDSNWIDSPSSKSTSTGSEDTVDTVQPKERIVHEFMEPFEQKNRERYQQKMTKNKIITDPEFEEMYKKSRLPFWKEQKRNRMFEEFKNAIAIDIQNSKIVTSMESANAKMQTLYPEYVGDALPFTFITKFIPYGSFVSGFYDKESDFDLSFYLDVEYTNRFMRDWKNKNLPPHIEEEYKLLKKEAEGYKTSQIELLEVITSPKSFFMKQAKMRGYYDWRLITGKTKLLTLSNKKLSIDITITKPGNKNNISRWMNFYLNVFDTENDDYRKFIFAIKNWAKNSSLVDPHNFMGAFGYYLLCLKFLREKHYLPLVKPGNFTYFTAFAIRTPWKTNIETIHEDNYRVTLRGDCYFYRDDEILFLQKTKETKSIAELISEFFDYYSLMFDQNQVYLSLDQAATKPKSQSAIFRLDDPLDPQNNIAKNMTSKNFSEFKQLFQKEKNKSF